MKIKSNNEETINLVEIHNLKFQHATDWDYRQIHIDDEKYHCYTRQGHKSYLRLIGSNDWLMSFTNLSDLGNEFKEVKL